MLVLQRQHSEQDWCDKFHHDVTAVKKFQFEYMKQVFCCSQRNECQWVSMEHVTMPLIIQQLFLEKNFETSKIGCALFVSGNNT